MSYVFHSRGSTPKETNLTIRFYISHRLGVTLHTPKIGHSRLLCQESDLFEAKILRLRVRSRSETSGILYILYCKGAHGESITSNSSRKFTLLNHPRNPKIRKHPYRSSFLKTCSRHVLTRVDDLKWSKMTVKGLQILVHIDQIAVK